MILTIIEIFCDLLDVTTSSKPKSVKKACGSDTTCSSRTVSGNKVSAPYVHVHAVADGMPFKEPACLPN